MGIFNTRLGAALAVLRGKVADTQGLKLQVSMLTTKLAAERTRVNELQTQLTSCTSELEKAVAAVEGLAAEFAPPLPKDSKSIQAC